MICSDSLWNGLLLDVTWFLVAPGYGCASTLRRQVTRVTPKKWSHHLPITKDCWGRVSVFQSKTHWTSFNFSIVLAPSVDSPRFFFGFEASTLQVVSIAWCCSKRVRLWPLRPRKTSRGTVPRLGRIEAFFLENMGLSKAIGSMVLVYLPTKLGHWWGKCW